MRGVDDCAVIPTWLIDAGAGDRLRCCCGGTGGD